MKNKKMVSMFAFGLVVFLGISLVAAYQGDYSAEGPAFSTDRHEVMTQAFEDLDYDAWVALMVEGGKHSRVMDVVNEDNFALFVEAREAGMSGDTDRAIALRSELGLGNGVGSKDGTGFGGGKGMKKHGMNS